MKIHSHACTHVGRRQNNEDAYCAEPRLGLFAVADGMGGYEGGEVASHLVIDTMTEFFRRHGEDRDCTWPIALDGSLSYAENMVQASVLQAHQRVCQNKTGKLSAMGSTVATLLLRGGRAVIGHVGDSRVYRLRGGELRQLTRDHSLYNEMAAVRGADMPPREKWPHGNIITRAVGLDKSALPDVKSEPLEAGDVFLLCSDGLSEVLPERRLSEVLSEGSPRLCCATLVEEAFARGSKDNITAVVVKLAA